LSRNRDQSEIWFSQETLTKTLLSAEAPIIERDLKRLEIGAYETQSFGINVHHGALVFCSGRNAEHTEC
jgi:hypothetical protein